MSDVINFLVTFGFLVAFFAVVFVLSVRAPRWVMCLFMSAWCVGFFVVAVVTGDQFSMAINALCGSYWIHEFWRNKPPFDRKKVAKLIGAKAKALKAKLVASMPQASPVALPVPAGV